MFMHRDLSRLWSVAGGIVACALVIGVVACPVAVGGQTPASSESLDQILKELSTYDGGIVSSAVWKLRDYVNARKDDEASRAECETTLLAFLKSPATPVAKMTAARHLRVIAGDRAVPALQALISDERSADLAIYALQQIPGPVAEGALIEALKTATGATKVAVVAALGERKAASAVPAIAQLLQQPALAVPAAIALGRIGGERAVSALESVFATASDGLKSAVASSVLSCAEAALAAKDNATALRLYEALSSDGSLPVAVRKAAVIGRISAAGSSARPILWGSLVEPGTPIAAGTADMIVRKTAIGSDAAMQEAAIAKIADVFTPDDIGPICALLPRLPDRSKVQLLAVLSSYPGDRVAPAVMQELTSPTAAVRIAALRALGSIGGPSAVRPLADAASRARGAEQVAARAALGMLKGRAVDDEIVAQLTPTPADDVARELLFAVGDRRIFPAKAVVTAALASPSLRIRVQALKALRSIGSPSDITAVLDLLLKSTDDSERAEIENAVIGLAQKIEGADGRSRAIRARLSSEKRIEARVRLIGVLPLVADSSALPVLRALCDHEDADIVDAAVRAMTAWPTPAAREDLLRLSRDSRNQTHRLLAIAGLVRVVALDKYRDPQAAVADLRQAASVAWRPEEQKLVLAALGQFATRDALELARGFLQEPDVKTEAQAAIDKITPRLTKEAIRK